MQPSTHQQQVIDWLQADSDARDAVVNSVAGSGKSTLLVATRNHNHSDPQ